MKCDSKGRFTLPSDWRPRAFEIVEKTESRLVLARLEVKPKEPPYGKTRRLGKLLVGDGTEEPGAIAAAVRAERDSR